MGKRYYTDDRNTQILLSLLKQHGIKKAIVSPGTTNIALVASMQYDPWFEVYSSVDERSAAYMACGMAEASGEPVIISCTGATASRNYFPGLTEAYYRKLPVLAITGSHGEDIIGHLHAQSLDRIQAPKDTVIFSTCVKVSDTTWKATIEANKAILELTRHGGGPVHIDLESAAYGSFTTEELPLARKINRFTTGSLLPAIDGRKVAIFVGAHKRFTDEESSEIERFCESNNAVVFVDHTSGYYGKYSVNYALVAGQRGLISDILKPEVLIHIGEISGDFYTSYGFNAKETWRVSEDGEIRDLFSNLKNVFEMSDISFFSSYRNESVDLSYYHQVVDLYHELASNIPEIPFGNIWIAQKLHDKLPQDSELFVSIFNSLRSWNFFEIDKSIATHCNVGGFGIDGAMSTMLGSAIINPSKLHFCVTGDLAFFYDMNCLGNRHVTSNIRILVINNGKGTEFKNYDHPGAKWGDKADEFIAAAGHFGRQSSTLIKHYAEDLGFEYLTAKTKEEFENNVSVFTSAEVGSKPMIFEVFTESENESFALQAVRSIVKNNRSVSDKILSIAQRIINKLKR